MVLICFIGAAIGSPSGFAIYTAEALQGVGLGVMAAWFGAVVARARQTESSM
jgi:hypothetical protein